MNISEENVDTASEVLKKYSPSVLSVIGVVGMLEAAEINKRRQESLTNAYSQLNTSYELYKAEVKRNRNIFYRVKKFFKRLFHK